MQATLLSFFKDLPLGMVITGPDMQVKWINNKAVEYLGTNNPAVVRVLLRKTYQERLLSGANKLISLDLGKNKVGFCITSNDNDTLLFVLIGNDLNLLNLLGKELDENTLGERRYYFDQVSGGIVPSRNPVMKKIVSDCLKIANINTTIIIYGESGVGKDVMAKIIHQAGERSSGSMLRVNCGCIPENLLEAELFGYEEGAFTGAKKGGKPGLFQVAHGGTIYLDEIGEMPISLQVKLLRVIQDREIYRVGGTEPLKIDVRIIAATNKDLKQLVHEGRFREDLYYRLNVIPIIIPPLRERIEDIIPLAEYFIIKYNREFNLDKTFMPEALKVLEQYHWPGNIRQLENFIQRAIIFCEGLDIQAKELEKLLETESVEFKEFEFKERVVSLQKVLDETEKNVLAAAKKNCRTTREIARLLKISQPSVVRKLKKHSL